MGKKRRAYSDEFRLEALKLISEPGVNVAQVARDLGIAESLLYSWRRKYRGQEVSDKGGPTADQKRIRELEKENKRLRMEREILKKATAYFAKESE